MAAFLGGQQRFGPARPTAALLREERHSFDREGAPGARAWWTTPNLAFPSREMEVQRLVPYGSRGALGRALDRADVLCGIPLDLLSSFIEGMKESLSSLFARGRYRLECVATEKWHSKCFY
ncbi:hypothetical protein [Methylacidimicrobium tartarophylax]|uniref:Uncharacterized protein n=1 Tax=Methylacidimicrobium tartarophylax TaxID=1041768 RepID=A0A5E6M5J6_9BACT|nr:hypothetical protein [Methylacidimicrobium tartarophylax]VVM04615.1 hypothetical protein MAMT_00186 [Methylacidimicrobium tartarophylax]